MFNKLHMVCGLMRANNDLTNSLAESPVKGGGYGDAMMRKAVNARREREKRGRNPHQELQDYLDSPLEDVVDRVKWWNVSIISDLLVL
jgi:hypothetical protein